jgi:hypothetical protein
MRTTRIRLIAVALGIGAAGAALAQKADKAAPPAGAPAGPPTPAPQMEQVKVFVGNWKCEGKVMASPMAPEHPYKASVTGKSDLDGFWVAVRIEEKKTKESPVPVKGLFQVTFDPGDKKFHALWNDNFGGWAPSASAGWEGDKMTFLGEANMGGQKVPSRDVFTKKGEKELAHVGEFQMGGKWVAFLEESCKR